MMQTIHISQPILFSSVVAERKRIEALLNDSADGVLLHVDALCEFDSSLLTLILCLQRHVQKQNKQLRVQGPMRLRQVADVYGLTPVFESILSEAHG